MEKRSIGFIVKVPKEWKERIARAECPCCGKPKSEWKRRKDWRCCSQECTEKFNKECFKYWITLRSQAFERDKNTCVKCKRKFELCSSLIGDHIIPIALGGEEYSLDNIQTLCIDCNKIKTAEDIKKIAELRSIEKKQKGNAQLNTTELAIPPASKEVGILANFI